MLEIINFILYALLLFFLLRNGKTIFSIFVAAIWAGSSFVGIFYSHSNAMREGLHNVELEPFIYLFICFVISMMPFIRQQKNIFCVYSNNGMIDIFCKFIAIIAIYPFFETLYQLLNMVVSGRFLLLGANYDDFANGNTESLIKYSKLGIYTSRVLFWFKVLTPVLFFYNLQKLRKDKFTIIGLGMASFVPALSNMSIGSKTELIFLLLYYIGLYLYMRKCFLPDIRKRIHQFLFILLGLILSASIALSIGRYVIGNRYSANDNSTFDYLFMYSAESMFNFNQNAYHETTTLNGFETSQAFMLQTGLTDVSMKDRRFHISRIIKSPAQLFYNYIGDMYLDWGWLGAIISITLLSFMFSCIRIKQKMELENIAIMSIYIYLMVNSIFYFCYKMSFAPIFSNILFAIISKYVIKTKQIYTYK